MNRHATTSAVLALVRKDLRLYFSNRRALLMSIAAPIAIAAFFGSLFSADMTTSPIPVAVTDLDASRMSGAIVQALRRDTALAVQTLDATLAADAVRAGKVRTAIVIPAGFGAAAPAAMFGGAARPVVAVSYDPSQPTTLAIVRGLLTQHVMDAAARELFSGSAGGPMAGFRPASGASPTAPRPGGFTVPFETRATEATAAPAHRYNSYAHSFAGMGVQFILFMGIELGVGVLMARRLGLWKRLRAAPLTRTALLGSHLLGGALIALILLAIIYAAAIVAFGVRIEGSVPGFIGVAVAFALLTSSFGLLIAALGKTPEATRGLAIFATLVLVMLGGAWVPSFVFPQWLQTATLVVPTRWAVDGLDAMTWRGLGFDAAIAPIAVLLGFATLFAAIAITRFDWEESGA